MLPRRPTSGLAANGQLNSGAGGMRRRCLWILAVAGALLPAVGAAQTVEVRVRVLDAGSNQPVATAWVEMAGGQRRLGADSTGLVIMSLIRGHHAFSVHALGYGSVTQALHAAGDTTLVVRLTIAPLSLEGLAVVADRFARRNRALPWNVGTVGHDELINSAAADPVDALRGRHVQLQPCRGGGDCVRYRGSPVTPVVCIDDQVAQGGLAELRTYPMASLHSIEVHGRGRMVRAYTTWFMDRVASGDMALKAALRADQPTC